MELASAAILGNHFSRLIVVGLHGVFLLSNVRGFPRVSNVHAIGVTLFSGKPNCYS